MLVDPRPPVVIRTRHDSKTDTLVLLAEDVDNLYGLEHQQVVEYLLKEFKMSAHRATTFAEVIETQLAFGRL